MTTTVTADSLTGGDVMELKERSLTVKSVNVDFDLEGEEIAVMCETGELIILSLNTMVPISS